MRRLSAFVTLCLAFVLPGVAFADALSKPLRSAVPATEGATVVLENLAGRVEVVAGRGSEAVLTGTVFADGGSSPESQRLLDGVVIEIGGGSRPTLHVTYPVDRAPLRYHSDENESSLWSHSSSTVDYQGRRVKVTEGGSTDPLLYADLKLEVPPGVAVLVTNHLGRVTARGVGADLEVKTASADITADDVAGKLRIRTGSGDVRVGGSAGLDVSTGSGDISAELIRGAVTIHTGSGDVKLARADTKKVSVHTGSGDVALDDVAGSLELRTGSGDIEGRGLKEVERLDVGTGSGQITLTLDAARLAEGEVEAASGDVALSFASAPAMTLSVSTASGDIDAENLAGTRVTKRTERRLEAEVRGGGANLRIHTASGDVRIR